MAVTKRSMTKVVAKTSVKRRSMSMKPERFWRLLVVSGSWFVVGRVLDFFLELLTLNHELLTILGISLIVAGEE